MSLYHGCRTLTRRFRLVLSSFLQSDGLPFGDTLPEEEIERTFEEEGVLPWSGDRLRELSFTAAIQAIAASWMVAVLTDRSMFGVLVDAHLANLAGHRVGHRPDCVEPRAVKRRPKPHRLLTKPRAEARLDLLAGVAT